MLRWILLAGLTLFVPSLSAASFPLETVLVQGTLLPESTVVRISGLRIGSPADKSVLDEAAAQLSRSGLFASVEYRFAPGKKGGYALTLMLTDWTVLLPAVIDIPGVDEDSVWKWLALSYPPFVRRVPDSGAALDFLSREIETHFADPLGGGRVTTVLETSVGGGAGSVMSFQPADLPRVGVMTFEGNREIASSELEAILRKLIGDSGYLDRRFRALVELNLRRAYEERGMFRVRFPSISAERSGSNLVAVKLVMEEGPKFTFGAVRIDGDGLPADAILKEGGFRLGQTANWTEIQQSIYRTLRPLRRLGFLDASANPERQLDDAKLILNVDLKYSKGQLYRLGLVSFEGLSASQETKARRLWKLREGEPYDLGYSDDFLTAFSASEDLRAFRNVVPNMKRRSGEPVVDLILKFVPR